MIYIIANAFSGKGKGDECLKKVYNYLNERDADYVSFVSEYAGHSTKLAQVASAQPDCELIVAVGGDGTLNEVVSGMDLSVPVAFIPAGTGNDFVKGAGLPTKTEEILDLALSGSIGAVDVMVVNGRRCLNVAGSGFDVNVLLTEDKIRKFLPGKISYMIALLVSLICFKFSKITISVDGEAERDMPILLLAAANGKFYGGGMPISPGANIDDGYMDLVIIKKLPRYKIPYLFIKFFAEKLMEVKKYVEFCHCKKVSFTIFPKLPVNVDGELIPVEETTIEILPRSLRVVSPQTMSDTVVNNEENISINI